MESTKPHSISFWWSISSQRRKGNVRVTWQKGLVPCRFYLSIPLDLGRSSLGKAIKPIPGMLSRFLAAKRGVLETSNITVYSVVAGKDHSVLHTDIFGVLDVMVALILTC